MNLREQGTIIIALLIVIAIMVAYGVMCLDYVSDVLHNICVNGEVDCRNK